MKSDAKTVNEYLAGLPEDRRDAIVAVRGVVLRNLPEGYQETMNWGMICYEVPLSAYPDTYNNQPLMYAALASQKQHMAIYMTGLYSMPGMREEFEAAYERSGKKLDMGKSCLRFKSLDDLALDVIGTYIAAVPMTALIAAAQAVKKSK